MQGCYIYQQKGRKVGDIGGDLLMLGIVGVAGYLVYKNFFGAGNAQSTNNQGIDTNTQTTVTADQQKAAAAGITQSVSDSTLSTIANTLFYQLGNGDDPSTIVNSVVSNLNNYADWLRLVQLFGTKQFNTGGSLSSCALLGLGCSSMDLGTALKTVLPAAYISNLDSFFSDQGIPVIL